jgi:hypothetical protein
MRSEHGLLKVLAGSFWIDQFSPMSFRLHDSTEEFLGLACKSHWYKDSVPARGKNFEPIDVRAVGMVVDKVMSEDERPLMRRQLLDGFEHHGIHVAESIDQLGGERTRSVSLGNKGEDQIAHRVAVQELCFGTDSCQLAHNLTRDCVLPGPRVAQE